MSKLPIILLTPMVLAGGCAQPMPSPESEATTPPSEQEPSEIIIVYDNNPFDSSLKTAWGFSCLVRLPQMTILFDTGGDSPTLLGNMRQLQVNPKEVEAVVLSHIHGDHAGGLGGFLEQNSKVTVYLPGSFPPNFKDDVRCLGAKVEEIYEAKELMPGVYTTGELGDWIREQSLILDTTRGLVIITGCAHPGIVNIIQRAKKVVPDSKVYLVIGGFHLGGASSSELKSIINEFRQLGVERVAPCHCSGDQTRRLFKQDYAENYIESGVGRRIALPPR